MPTTMCQTARSNDLSNYSKCLLMTENTFQAIDLLQRSVKYGRR